MDVHIAIVGAGKIGSYVAAELSKNPDYHIHLVARSNFDALKESGIFLSDTENITHFSLYRHIREVPPCDLVIIAVPVSANAGLLTKDLPIFSPNTRVVTLQNGLNFEQVLAESIPEGTPFYSGTCWIKVGQKTPSSFQHVFGETTQLGLYSGRASPEIKELFEFKGSELKVELSGSIHSVQVSKIALNVPFFFLMAKHGKSISEILMDPTLAAEREKLQNKIVDAGQKIGLSIDTTLIDQTVADLRKMPPSPPFPKEFLMGALASQLDPLVQFLKARGVSLQLDD